MSNQIKNSETSARFKRTAHRLLVLPLTELHKRCQICTNKKYINNEQSFPVFISKGRMSHNRGVRLLLKTKTHVDKLKYMLIFAQIKMFSNLPTLYPLEDNLMNCNFTCHKT